MAELSETGRAAVNAAMNGQKAHARKLLAGLPRRQRAELRAAAYVLVDASEGGIR